MARPSRRLLGLVAVGAVLFCACGDTLAFGVRDLEVTPDPAQPGQAVTFAFMLTIVPAHAYTITAWIDDQVHATVTGAEVVDGPFAMPVGDAADLIAQYGPGEHAARITVELTDDGREASTGMVRFELLETPL